MLGSTLCQASEDGATKERKQSLLHIQSIWEAACLKAGLDVAKEPAWEIVLILDKAHRCTKRPQITGKDTDIVKKSSLKQNKPSEKDWL